MRRMVVLMLAVALVAGLTVPAGAAEAADGPQTAAQMQVIQARVERAIERMSPHVRLASDGTLTLDMTSGRRIGVSRDVFEQLKASLEQTNELIRAGVLDGSDLVDGGYVDVPVESSPTAVLAAGTDGIAAASSYCSGVTTFRYRWWGYQYYLNSCDTQLLIGLIQAGIGAAALCSAFGVTGIACTVLAGVLAIGGAYVAIVASRGNGGIIINQTWIGVWWLSPQY